MEIDWQSENFQNEDDKNINRENEYEIQENFLGLKHIDKSTTGKSARPNNEKTMIQLINECKVKNTTYETIMNTWKNINNISNL